MIQATKTITATNTDVLSGTELASIPSSGQVDIYAAATQNDWTLTIGGPGQETIVREQKVQLRSNGMPSLQDDVPFTIPFSVGGKLTISLTVGTAGTGNVIAIFRPAEELVAAA